MDLLLPRGPPVVLWRRDPISVCLFFFFLQIQCIYTNIYIINSCRTCRTQHTPWLRHWRPPSQYASHARITCCPRQQKWSLANSSNPAGGRRKRWSMVWTLEALQEGALTIRELVALTFYTMQLKCRVSSVQLLLLNGCLPMCRMLTEYAS